MSTARNFPSDMPSAEPARPRRRLRPLRWGAIAAGIALAGVLLPISAASAAPAQHSSPSPKPTIVLVHGAWADGSSWSGEVRRLQDKGYTVDVPPNPLRGVASDSAYLAAYLATVTGPVVLVGHSYGGFVITDAAVGNPNVKALVYIDAYVPAKGETPLSLTGQFPGSQISPAVLNFVPSAGGVVNTYIKPALFPGIFANDLPACQGAVLAASQEPLALSALSEPSGVPAWKTIPSWDLIGTADHVIVPAAQEFMAHRAGAHIETIPASHLSLISHPRQVTDLIIDAAQATG